MKYLYLSRVGLTFSLVLLSYLGLAQQKKALTHADYDQWQIVGTTTISDKGKWIAAAIEPQVGDDLVQVSNTDGDIVLSIPRGNRGRFTSTEGFFALKIKPQYDTVRMLKLAETPKDELPDDSLAVFQVGKGWEARYAHVKSFRIPQKGGDWMAFMYEKGFPKDEADTTDEKPLPGHTLVIQQLGTENQFQIDRVSKYSWAREGGRLAILREASADSVQDAGIVVFDCASGEFVTIDSGQVTYQNITWDDPGKQLAYLATPDSTEAELRHFAVHLWKPTGQAAMILSNNSAGIPNNWWISSNGAVYFNKAGNRLFLSTEPMPIKYQYEEDTTLLDDDRPEVDIWNWQDKRLQPEQLLDQSEDRSRSYIGMINLSTASFVQLEDEGLSRISLDLTANGPAAIGIDQSPYQLSYSWTAHWRSDIYHINLADGQRTLVYAGATNTARMSPHGKFFYWYEVTDSSWMVYDVASRSLANVSDNIPYPMWNEEDDHPMMPNAYGTSGWTENDEALWVNDRYDIWSVDPLGKQPPVNLTKGQGRNNNTRFRSSPFEYDDLPYHPKGKNAIIVGFDLDSKATGFYALNFRRQKLTTLHKGDFSLSYLDKAPNSNTITFEQGTFQDSPDLFVADWKFSNITQLTETNPQQGEYKWGSVELVSYRSLDGVPLQGLLYKPEDFDPAKKYPMVVYFYEKSSDGLHGYHSPRPSASTINRAWAVSNGYLVFVPDIVYKDGLPGPSAYDCIVPGTMAMIDKGFVDEKAIGLQGQSWGGYQIAYLITRTNLYSAAMAGAPVANMTSAYGGIRWGSGLSRMFQYERTQSRIGGTLWDAQNEYIENSPVFFADRVETPLLMMHNDKDTAVPWYQGIEYFVALRRLRKPVWLLVYNGEPHNLRQRRNRLDLSMRMGQFFNHYLKGEPAPLWMREGLPAMDKGRYLGYELEKDDELLIEE